MSAETGTPTPAAEDEGKKETMQAERKGEIITAGRTVVLENAEKKRAELDQLSYEERVQRCQDKSTMQLYLAGHPDRLIGQDITHGSVIRVDVGSGQKAVTQVLSGTDKEGYVCQLEGEADPVKLSKDQLSEAYFLAEKDAILPLFPQAEQALIQEYIHVRTNSGEALKKTDEELAALLREAGFVTTGDIKAFLEKTLSASPSADVQSEKDELLSSLSNRLLAPAGAGIKAISIVEGSMGFLSEEAKQALATPDSLNLSAVLTKQLASAFRDGDTTAVNALLIRAGQPEKDMSTEPDITDPLNSSLGLLQESIKQMIENTSGEQDTSRLKRLQYFTDKALEATGPSANLLKAAALTEASRVTGRKLTNDERLYIDSKRAEEADRLLEFAKSKGLRGEKLALLEEGLLAGGLGVVLHDEGLSKIFSHIDGVDEQLFGRELSKDEYEFLLGRRLSAAEEADLKNKKSLLGAFLGGFLLGTGNTVDVVTKGLKS